MDAADYAQDLIETQLTESLNKRRTLTIPFSGSCLCCGEPVQERRFCDADCRQDYEADLIKKTRF